VLVPQAGGTAFWREAGEGRQARRRPQPVAASAFAMPRRGAGLVEGGLHAHSRVLSAGVTVWDGSPQTTSLYPILPGDICFLDRCVWHQVPCPRLPCPAPAYLALPPPTLPCAYSVWALSLGKSWRAARARPVPSAASCSTDVWGINRVQENRVQGRGAAAHTCPPRRSLWLLSLALAAFRSPAAPANILNTACRASTEQGNPITAGTRWVIVIFYAVSAA
jgi:hypothetical protein